MREQQLATTVCVLALVLMPQVSRAIDVKASPQDLPAIFVTLPDGTAPPVAAKWTSRVIGIPGPPAVESKRGGRGPTLATFTNSVTVGRQRYTFTMVGSDPSIRGARAVVVPVQVIPVKLVFSDGSALDPTQANDCANGMVPLDLVLQSPLFQDADYGEGPKQFVEEIRRIEFWYFTGPGRLNPRYSVRLASSAPALLTVNLPPGFVTQAAICGSMATLPFSATDQIIQTQVIPQLKKFGVAPNTFPLFLLLNTIMSDPALGEFAVGYHSHIGSQSYGVASFDSTQVLPNISDIWVLSHEIAEWYDDPFVTNQTPPWGHIGQQRGCQSNLEVGDPLDGVPFGEIQMPNGFTYHPQETAFFSWFFEQKVSLGIGSWYSSNNSLTSPAAPCH